MRLQKENTMTDAKKLTEVLRQELALQNRYCKLLEAQKRALLACDRVSFSKLVPEQEAVAETLGMQETRRRATFQSEVGEPMTISALIKDLPEGAKRPVNALRNDLRKVLDKVAVLSQQNQVLIENELGYISFALDLFVDAGRKADSYGGSRGGRRLFLDRVA